MNYFCDLMYENEGHFDQDFEKFNNWCDGLLTHIKKQSNGFKTDIKNAKDCIKLQGHKVIGSVHYIPLFIASVFTRNWDYSLIIHFFPENHPIIYKYIIKRFLKKCNRIIVFDQAVKEYLIKKTNTKYNNKIFVMHTREVKKSSTITKQINNGKIHILVIGSLNRSKIIETLLYAIKSKTYDNIEFNFICHGINNRLKEAGFNIETDFSNTIKFEDRFPDLDEYKALLHSADYLYLAYTKEYGIRTSGALLDALAQGTPVIVNDNATLLGFVNNYNCGFSFTSQDELIKILSDINDGKKIKPIFYDKLYTDFSEEKNRNDAKYNLLG